MRNLACTVALLALSLASGCTLYFGDDDGDDICGGSGGADIAYDQLRDPSSGVCVDYGGGGGGCYGAPEPYPDWASCYSSCEGLDENTCFATAGCRAAYVEDIGCGPGEDCLPPTGPQTFYGCWGTAPSGPIQGSCDGLDAQGCSEHDDCIAVYNEYYGPDDGIETAFSYCAPEPWTQGCYGDQDCPAGYECNADTECMPDPSCGDGAECPPVCYGQCVPAQNGCDAVDCGAGYHCELQCYPCDPVDPNDTCDFPCDVTCVPDYPTCDDGQTCEPGSHCETTCTDPDPTCDADAGGACPGMCSSTCVPDSPSCGAVDCAPGTHCEESCPPYPCPEGAPDCACSIECVPDGVPDPGTCDGEVWCDAMPPTCPDGTVPGISNGCWSGYCIPVEDCGPNDPGSCYGDVTCDMATPACPASATPGIRNGCYTGYCIPLSACDQTATCESLDEAGCSARQDCTPVYNGGGCTCYPDGTCSCDEWQFDHCETGGVVMPPDPMPL
jgi:hypothetical protein